MESDHTDMVSTDSTRDLLMLRLMLKLMLVSTTVDMDMLPPLMVTADLMDMDMLPPPMESDPTLPMLPPPTGTDHTDMVSTDSTRDLLMLRLMLLTSMEDMDMLLPPLPTPDTPLLPPLPMLDTPLPLLSALPTLMVASDLPTVTASDLLTDTDGNQ